MLQYTNTYMLFKEGTNVSNNVINTGNYIWIY